METREGRQIIFALSSVPTATGTSSTSPAPDFPLDFMIRYHLYRISFPLLALGRMRERLSA